MDMAPNLTIRQLQTFREVMRSGSISEAGRTLGRTQPAVSSMISAIERELGFALFLREHGGLTPCPEAYYFLEEADQVLDRLDRAQRTMSEFSVRQRGELRIACHPAAANFFLPGVMAEFLADKPEVKADLMMRTSPVVEDLIASQEYDIGLAETPPPRSSILAENFNLSCRIALPAHHALASKDVIGPLDVGSFPLAMLIDEHATSVAIRAAFNAVSVKLNRRFSLRTYLPALELVSGGFCLSIVDGISAATCRTPGITFRPFVPEIKAAVSILLPAHRPMSRLTQGFRSALHERMTILQEQDLKSERG